MHIFHIAEKARWEAAELAGSYAQSTLDRSLDDEGFIHAAHEDQVDTVLERHYSGVRTPLVLLTIDTDRLTSQVHETPVGAESCPHIHGPINPSAVVDVRPLPTPAAPAAPATPLGPRRSFMGEFLAEFSFRIGAAVFVMVVALVCGFAGIAIWGDRSGLWCLLAGAALAVAAVVPVHRARERRRAQQPA